MQENIESCLLNNDLDSALAAHLILATQQRQKLDQDFQNWLRGSSASEGQTTTPRQDQAQILPGITVARNMMRWRCLNSQILVHRPVLLWYAMSQKPMRFLSRGEQDSIRRCFSLAADLINDIHDVWHLPVPCQMSGWYATWQLYQAAMIPVLLLYCGEDAFTDSCNSQIQTAISTFASLEQWSPAAKRTLEVMKCLHEASKSYSDLNHQRRHSVPLEDEAHMGVQYDLSQYPTAQLDDVVNGLAGFDPMDCENTLLFLDFWNPAAAPLNTDPSASEWLSM